MNNVGSVTRIHGYIKEVAGDATPAEVEQRDFTDDYGSSPPLHLAKTCRVDGIIRKQFDDVEYAVFVCQPTDVAFRTGPR